MAGRDNHSDGNAPRNDPRNDARNDPWRVPVLVAQIPENGLHRDFAADPAQLRALADIAGLPEVLSANASLDLAPLRNGGIHVTGSVTARIMQTCVVTLDPLENRIHEPIDVLFLPPELIPARPVNEDGGADEEETDPPEPLTNGTIDIGRLATDALFLGIDPYPRREGATFDLPSTPASPEDHPFAALRGLRDSNESVSPKKKP